MFLNPIDTADVEPSRHQCRPRPLSFTAGVSESTAASDAQGAHALTQLAPGGGRSPVYESADVLPVSLAANPLYGAGGQRVEAGPGPTGPGPEYADPDEICGLATPGSSPRSGEVVYVSGLAVGAGVGTAQTESGAGGRAQRPPSPVYATPTKRPSGDGRRPNADRSSPPLMPQLVYQLVQPDARAGHRPKSTRSASSAVSTPGYSSYSTEGSDAPTPVYAKPDAYDVNLVNADYC